MPVKKDFILSDESLNSYGFRVMTEGIDLSRFTQNPVMLLNHREYDVLGAWIEIRKDAGQLKAATKFDETDAETMRTASKVEQGFIKGASIGFEIIETSVDPALMLPGQTRPTVTKCVLYEASVTPLPSNSNALALYDNTGKKLAISDEVLNSCQLSLLSQQSPSITKNRIMKLNMKSLTALSLSENPTDDQINAGIEALSIKAANAEQRATKAEGELQTIKDEQTRLSNERAVALVAKAVTEKKLTADQKESWEKLAKQDYAAAEAALSTMKGVKQLNATIKDEVDETEGAEREKWTLTDWRKNDPAGLEALKLNESEKFEKLVAVLK